MPNVINKNGNGTETLAGPHKRYPTGFSKIGQVAQYPSSKIGMAAGPLKNSRTNQSGSVLSNTDGLKYVEAKGGSRAHYLLDITKLKETKKQLLELHFNIEESCTILTTVDIAKINTVSPALKIILNNQNSSKPISIQCGDLYQKSWRSRNPLKALMRLKSQGINPRIVFEKNSHNSLRSKNQSSIIIGGTKLVNRTSNTVSIPYATTKETFWTIKIASSPDQSLIFNFSKLTKEEQALSFVNFIQKTQAFETLKSILPPVEIFFSDQSDADNYREAVARSNKKFQHVIFFNSSEKLEPENFYLTLEILTHEFGHLIAKKIYGQTEPPRNSNYALAMRQDGKHVCKYGQKNSKEDFAESVRCFLIVDQIKSPMENESNRQYTKSEKVALKFKERNPNRYEAIKALLVN